MGDEITKHVIAVDSNCLTYLVSVINDVIQPSDRLATEKIALFRILIYSPPVYFTNTVKDEYDKIPDEKRKEMHDNTVVLEYHQIIFGLSKIITIATEYNKYHKGRKQLRDCKILAEAELMKADMLLTYDDDFYNHLRCRSTHVKLLKPSDCWDKLSIPHGAKPILRPKSTNPMSNETWWKW